MSTGGGWYPSMHCRSPGPHPGGKLRGLAWRGGWSPGPHKGGLLQAHTRGVSSRPTPGGCLQAHTGGSLGPYRGFPGPHPACTEASTLPPCSRLLLLRAVRILLECILVSIEWILITLGGPVHGIVSQNCTQNSVGIKFFICLKLGHVQLFTASSIPNLRK